jgi:hypothetical protein
MFSLIIQFWKNLNYAQEIFIMYNNKKVFVTNKHK